MAWPAGFEGIEERDLGIAQRGERVVVVPGAQLDVGEVDPRGSPPR
ncbi:hypothetical protein [Gordonia amicalis]|nr:hypothetical protein [Gordonia amicalis]MBA5846173.1 hypothetical protein [Gordonia amicalis]